jgi:hypothetical protein
MGVTAGIFLASILLKEMRYLLWYNSVFVVFDYGLDSGTKDIYNHPFTLKLNNM